MEKNFWEHCKTCKKFLFIRINQKFEMRNFLKFFMLNDSFTCFFFLLAIHPIRSINRLIDNFRQSHIRTHIWIIIINQEWVTKSGMFFFFFHLWEFFKCFYLINLNTDRKKISFKQFFFILFVFFHVFFCCCC